MTINETVYQINLTLAMVRHGRALVDSNHNDLELLKSGMAKIEQGGVDLLALHDELYPHLQALEDAAEADGNETDQDFQGHAIGK